MTEALRAGNHAGHAIRPSLSFFLRLTCDFVSWVGDGFEPPTTAL